MNRKKLEAIITSILILVFFILLIRLPKKEKPLVNPTIEIPRMEGLVREDSIRNIEEMEWGRDPFSSTPTEGQQIKDGVPILTGIIWDKAKPLAVINDDVVGIGGEVGGYKVTNIEKDRVILQKDREIYTLKLYKEDT